MYIWQAASIIIFILLCVWILYTVVANNSAADWIEEHFAEINEHMSREHCYVLYHGPRWRDISPSELTYGVCAYGEPAENRKVICARRMRYLIKRRTPDRIAYYVKLHGTYITPQRARLELP